MTTNRGWVRPCNAGDCAEAVLDGDTVRVRSSRTPEWDVPFTVGEWRQFVVDVKAGRFDEVVPVAKHPVGDQVETAAQVLHARRHRAGTANVCGQCRDLALEIAEVFGVPRLTAIVERVESVRALGRPLRSGVETPPGLARWMLSGDRS